jgi:hypothetical protein
MPPPENNKSKKTEIDPDFEKYKKFNEEMKARESGMLNFSKQYVGNYSAGLDNIGKTISGLFEAASAGFKEGFFDDKAIELLEKQAQGVANSFGVSRGRIEEFKQIIADASPELVKMGIDQTKAAENYQAITKEMGGVFAKTLPRDPRCDPLLRKVHQQNCHLESSHPL